MASSSLIDMLQPYLNTSSAVKAVATLVAIPVVLNVAYFIRFIIKIRQRGKILDQLPGLPKHWLYGNLKGVPQLNSPEFLQYIQELLIKFPRVRRNWFGPLHCLVLASHPDTAKIILRSSEPKNVSVGSFYRMLLPWLGEGLLISNGDKWFRTRRLLTPAFHFNILKGYVDVMNECSEILVSRIEERMSQSDYVDLFSMISLGSLDIILRCAFSSNMDVQGKGSGHPYVTTVMEISRLFIKRGSNVLHRMSDFLYSWSEDGRRMRHHADYAHKVAEDIIAKRRSILVEEEKDVTRRKRYLDFLDILLTARDENGVGLTDLEIRNEVDTFLFEGHDTTTSGISWALYCLARNPDIQKKARAEVDQVMGSNADLTWDDLGKVPYLTKCIKESMRMYPPVVAVERVLSTPTTIEGVTLPVGTPVLVSIISLHHHPEVWGDNHEEFIPERFDPDNLKNMDSYSYVPFSAGPRNCIGQQFAMNEMKIVISKILRRFTLVPESNSNPAPVPEVILKDKYGLKLKFEPRE